MTDPLTHVWAALDGPRDDLPRLEVTGPPVTLRSRFAVTRPGSRPWAPACGRPRSAPTTRPRSTPVAGHSLRSERYLRRNGPSPGSPFDPLSAFHRNADGWLWLHANHLWHRAAALRVLGCTEQDAATAVAARGAVELETALHEAAGHPLSWPDPAPAHGAARADWS